MTRRQSLASTVAIAKIAVAACQWVNLNPEAYRRGRLNTVRLVAFRSQRLAGPAGLRAAGVG
jgi:hypothetical protein